MGKQPRMQHRVRGFENITERLWEVDTTVVLTRVSSEFQMENTE